MGILERKRQLKKELADGRISQSEFDRRLRIASDEERKISNQRDIKVRLESVQGLITDAQSRLKKQTDPQRREATRELIQRLGREKAKIIQQSEGVVPRREVSQAISLASREARVRQKKFQAEKQARKRQVPIKSSSSLAERNITSTSSDKAIVSEARRRASLQDGSGLDVLRAQAQLFGERDTQAFQERQIASGARFKGSQRVKVREDFDLVVTSEQGSVLGRYLFSEESEGIQNVFERQAVEEIPLTRGNIEQGGPTGTVTAAPKPKGVIESIVDLDRLGFLEALQQRRLTREFQTQQGRVGSGRELLGNLEVIGLGTLQTVGTAALRPVEFTKQTLGFGFDLVTSPIQTATALKTRAQTAPASFAGEVIGSTIVFKGLGVASRPLRGKARAAAAIKKSQTPRDISFDVGSQFVEGTVKKGAKIDITTPEAMLKVDPAKVTRTTKVLQPTDVAVTTFKGEGVFGTVVRGTQRTVKQSKGFGQEFTIIETVTSGGKGTVRAINQKGKVVLKRSFEAQPTKLQIFESKVTSSQFGEFAIAGELPLTLEKSLTESRSLIRGPTKDPRLFRQGFRTQGDLLTTERSLLLAVGEQPARVRRGLRTIGSQGEQSLTPRVLELQRKSIEFVKQPTKLDPFVVEEGAGGLLFDDPLVIRSSQQRGRVIRGKVSVDPIESVFGRFRKSKRGQLRDPFLESELVGVSRGLKQPKAITELSLFLDTSFKLSQRSFAIPLLGTIQQTKSSTIKIQRPRQTPKLRQRSILDSVLRFDQVQTPQRAFDFAQDFIQKQQQQQEQVQKQVTQQQSILDQVYDFGFVDTGGPDIIVPGGGGPGGLLLPGGGFGGRKRRRKSKGATRGFVASPTLIARELQIFGEGMAEATGLESIRPIPIERKTKRKSKKRKKSRPKRKSKKPQSLLRNIIGF